MNPSIHIPFTDLTAHHAPIRRELMEAIGGVIDSGAFSGGPFVEAFEKDFSSYCRTRFCVGVGSGTDALWLSLAALEIGPGDEVITVPATFVATVEAIIRTGARPVFVDIDPLTYTMNPEKLEEAISSRTKAIIPVHLYGRMADMRSVVKVAESYGIAVVEDAAQAHGASRHGRRAGSFGVTGCFSFYPGKNLGAFGEAGAVVTDDKVIADRLRSLREHGQHARNDHRVIGWNCRMDGIQAAVLRLKLGELDANNKRRAAHAVHYTRLLTGIPGLVPPAPDDANAHISHLYVIQVPERERFVARMLDRGIECSIHYPVPVHLQEAYSYLGHRTGDFPISESCAAHVVSLPMHANLTPVQIEEVAAAAAEAIGAVIAA